MPTCGIDFVRFVEENSRQLKSGDCLLPVYEAVSNSIHAIQEKNAPKGEGRVVVEIMRDASDALEGVKIEDNGVGFNDDNLDSFQRFYSSHKVEKGGKGVGRLFWLACFEDVEIESVYQKDGGAFGKRAIKFSLQNENNVVCQELDAGDNLAAGSVVGLRGVRKKFRSLTKKTTEEIAQALFEHFYLELERGVEITVKETHTGRLPLEEGVFELSQWKERAVNDALNVKGEDFHITTTRFRKSANVKQHQALYCANGRVAESVGFETLCGAPSNVPFEDEQGAYFVTVYVQSEYLDGLVDQTRTKLRFPEDDADEDARPTREDVGAEVAALLRSRYQEEIATFEAKKKQTIDDFVRDNPQNRGLYEYAKPELDALKWNATADDVANAFQKARARLETTQRRAWDAFKKIDRGNVTAEEVKEQFNRYLELVTLEQRDNLTNYVLRRKAVIEILEYFLNKDDSGNYQKEKAIHDLIYPMRTTSDDADSLSNNIWLIDDKLIPYGFITSDIPLKDLPGIESDSGARPDLLAFDNPMAFAIGANKDVEITEISSLVVVEFKKPMRADYATKGNPVDQVLSYVRKLKKGYKNKKGRDVKLGKHVRIYCYIIADITESLANSCGFMKKTYDGQGFFGVCENPNAYIEVISYDKLLSDAKKRNAEFFRRLGLPGNAFIQEE